MNTKAVNVLLMYCVAKGGASKHYVSPFESQSMCDTDCISVTFASNIQLFTQKIVFAGSDIACLFQTLSSTQSKNNVCDYPSPILFHLFFINVSSGTLSHDFFFLLYPGVLLFH